MLCQFTQVSLRVTWTPPLFSATLVTASVQSSSSASTRPTLMVGPLPNGLSPFAGSLEVASAPLRALAVVALLLSLPIDADGVAATAAQSPAAIVMAKTARDVRLAKGLSREMATRRPFRF
jgi:hypothetical protein